MLDVVEEVEYSERLLVKVIMRLFLILACVFEIAAQTNLPVVNVSVLKGVVPEGLPGYFIFTSDQKSNLTVRFEISGSASTNDFDPTVRGAFTSPGSVQIAASSYITTLTMLPIVDGLLEPTELVKVKLVPSPFYTIGPASEAVLEILDGTSAGTPTNPPSIFLSPPATNLVVNVPASFRADIIDTNSTNVTVQLYIDDVIIAQKSVSSTNRGVVSTVSLDWPDPTSGSHKARVLLFDDRGSSVFSNTREFFVSEAILAPAREFTLSHYGDYWEGVSAARNSPSDENEGHVEFDVPEIATNTQAILRFHAQVRDRVDMYAYAAGPTNYHEILQLPHELAASLGTNTTNVEIDITHWARKYAGAKLGFVFIVPPEIKYSSAGFDRFALWLLSPGFAEGPFDAPPAATLLNRLAAVTVTNSLTLSFEISDPDSPITAAVLFDNNEAIATNAPAGGYPTGTNVIQYSLPEIAKGPHRFVLRATSSDRSSSSTAVSTYITRADSLPRHRWLGSQDGSGSFYVVDAAGRARVWGHNEEGQLGLNLELRYLSRPATLLPPAGRRFLKIASRDTHAFGLMDDGSIYLLGGGNQTGLKPLPMPFGVPYFQAISTEYSFGAAIDPLDRVWIYDRGLIDVWGRPTGPWHMIKTEVDGYVAYGALPSGLPESLRDFAWGVWPYSYAITKEHQLYYWTNNAPTLTRMTVDGVSGWQRVVTSWFLTLAIDDSGKIWSWGPSGGGIEESKVVAFPKPITNWLDIAVSGQSSIGTQIAMALSAEGELYAWGQAYKGVWADPNSSVASVPELVPGLPNLLDENATGVAAPILSTSLTPAGLSVRVVAAADVKLHLETSTDLVHWTAAAINNSQSYSGVATITLPIDATGARFVRIVP